jgi:hypothetical protein
MFALIQSLSEQHSGTGLAQFDERHLGKKTPHA